MRKAIVAAALGLGVTTLLGHPSDARADEIAGLPKATVGGGFLGAEVVAIPMAIAGVSAGWAYAVFPGLGAIGGAIGGFFVDQAYGSGSSSAGTQQPAYGSTFMLAGGMALIIPTIVLMLNATRYHPSAEATEDHAPTNVGPEANPGKTGGSAVTPSGGGGATEAPPSTTQGGTTAPPPPPPYVPLSLLDVHEGSLRMGIPLPEVRNAYSMREIKELGVRQGTELRVPVFKLAF
jgi:hypothetical protein